MVIVKEGGSDWPGNNKNMVSDNSLKLELSKSSQDVVRCFYFTFGVKSLVVRGVLN